MSFGCITNDLRRLDMCLVQSEFKGVIDTMHVEYNPESATKGLNKILAKMEAEGADVGVLAHHDMFFRQGWILQAQAQIAKLPYSWIVAGIIGKCMKGLICGKFHDMRIPLHFNTSDVHRFPQEACCFDECVIIVNLKKGFRFDETLDDFHLYGTLCVLQAWEMGGTAWIIDAFAEHYCMRSFDWFPDLHFQENYKWLHERFKTAPRIDSSVLGVPDEIREAAQTIQGGAQS